MKGWALLLLLLWATGAQADDGAVDLNTAPPEVLMTLPGIGPKKAEAIIALRKRHPFTRISQLLAVRGIGEKTLQRLRPRLRVERIVRAEVTMGEPTITSVPPE